MRKVKIGLKGLSFEAAHYTPSGGKCEDLHGHTFVVDVEIEGEPGPDGMVMDFRELKKAVEAVLASWDHSLVVPERDARGLRLEGPFGLKLKVLRAPAATTEYMALQLAEELARALGRPVRVRVWEGLGKYAEAEAPAASAGC